MTSEKLKELFPNASHDFINNNSSERVYPAVSKRAEGVPLERPVTRETPGGECPKKRFKITFRVFAVRPMDWDNPTCKQIQDRLVEAGILPDDNWKLLSGEIITEKAHQETDQRTEITITAQ